MDLQVQFTKRADGNVVLRCTRKDGSATWKRYDNQATFFSRHDLSHFAVETVLGLTRGFFGLIAEGWDISDMDGKGPRGRPDGSVPVENIVGLFTQERAGVARRFTATEFNAQLAAMTGQPLLRPLTDAELEAVRARMDSLYQRWADTPSGSTLDLIYPGIAQ
jgi:hypothetical protein